MAFYAKGLYVGNSKVIDSSTNASFSSLNVTASDTNLQSLYTTNASVQQRLAIGGVTNSVNLNFGNGHGACINLQSSTVTVSNTGIIADISSCYLGAQPLQGNVSQTLGDLSTLYIAGAPSITNAVRSGSNWALKVGTGNVCFGGSLLAVSTTLSSTTNSTSALTGALTVAGGIGVAQDIHCDGNLSVGAVSATTIGASGTSTFTGAISSTNTTNATNITSGSIRTLGGIGVAQDIYCGGTITCNTLSASNFGFAGALILTGALRLKWATSASTSIVLGNSDCYIECTAASNVAVTLPSLSGGIQGQVYVIQHASDSVIQVTISANGTDRIGGVVSSPLVLYTKYSSAKIIAGSTSWISL